MKKKVSKGIAISSAIVAVVVIAVLMLSFWYVKPMSQFSGYDYVNVYDLSSVNRKTVSTDNAAAKAAFDGGLDKAKYSVMHAMLEGKFSYGLKFKTERDEDDQTVRSEVKSADIASYAATDTSYMIEFVYDEVRTLTVQGEEVRYDRARMLVADASGEVSTVEMLLYEYARVGNESVEENSSEFYTVCPVLMKINGTGLFNALSDTIDLLA